MKTIQETKCTCTACGNVWYFGKQEAVEQAGNAMQDVGKSMMCCGGCIPAAFLPNKKVIDLKQCPKCHSKAVNCEVVKHEVQ